jgi:hypothetical protein
MLEITNLLPNFKSLKEYREFMEQLVEKSASGQEISRGMDQHDKSKDQKKKEQVVTKEVQKSANGASKETHYDHIDTNVEQESEPQPQPQPPGTQVNIGQKPTAPVTDKKTIEIKIGGEKDKINMKPRLDKNLRFK